MTIIEHNIVSHEIYEEIELNKLYSGSKSLLITDLSDDILLFYKSVDLIKMWIDRIDFKLQDFELEDSELEYSQFKDDLCSVRLNFYQEIPILPTNEFIASNIEKFCSLKSINIKRDNEIFQENNFVPISRKKIEQYYGKNFFQEEKGLHNIMDSITGSLENNSGFQDIKDFLLKKNHSDYIDNFVALIYLYHFGKVDFKKMGKRIEVMLNPEK